MILRSLMTMPLTSKDIGQEIGNRFAAVLAVKEQALVRANEPIAFACMDQKRKSFIGMACQKNWTLPILTEMRKILENRR
jgi:hypothetical protein